MPTHTASLGTPPLPVTAALADAPASTSGVRTVSLPTSRAVPRTSADSARRTSAQIGHVFETPDSRIAYAVGPANGTDTSHATGGTGAPHGAERVGAADSATTTGAASGKQPSDSGTTRDSVTEKALSSAGRLPPAVLGDILRQREQLLQYCYTAFGLRVDRSLAGQIVVRIVIGEEGTVSNVSVSRRSWSGRGADAVESCIRDRVSAWQFPTAQRASTHEIQLIFGH
jgi:outer membrane biosynthesis protein TonB